MVLVTFLLRRLLLVSLIFHKFIEAVFQAESEYQNRALLTYNLDTDLCRQVSPHSHNDTKKAANKACAMAFHALDRLEGNSCGRWRDAECRLIHGFNHLQCTCLMPASVYVENRNHDVIPFRECAWKLYTEEVLEGEAQTVSPKFECRKRKIYDDSVESARDGRGGSTSAEAGSSQVSKRQRTGGDISGATTSAQGGSASWGVEIQGVPDTTGSPGPSTSANPGKKRRKSWTRKLHECEVCGEEFPVLKDLKNHAKSHKPEAQCSICNELFAHTGTLKSHMKKCQRETTKAKPVSAGPRPPREEPAGPHKCSICEKSYKWEKSLKAHIKVHNDQGQCEVCGATFSTVINYGRHFKNSHPEAYKAKKEEEELVKMIEKPFECETCGSRFALQSTMRLHQAVHRGETKCSQCNKVFPRKTMLNAHMKNDHS